MNSLTIANDEYTLKAINLFEFMDIIDCDKLSIEEVATQYNEAIQKFQKNNINDSVFYYVACNKVFPGSISEVR